MRRALALALALVSGAVSCRREVETTPPVTKPQPVAPAFAPTIAAILSAYYAARPTVATNLGEHAHDGVWPDISAKGIAADRARIDDALAKLHQAGAGKLSADERIDLEILQSELELQKFGHEVEQPWRRDPLWVTGTIGGGLEDLVSRDFAPIADRAASAASRLEALPAFCEEAAAAIVAAEAYPPQSKVAVGQIDGIVVLVEQVLPERLAEAPAETRGRIVAATPTAISALRALQRKLADEVVPAARGQWRLGAEQFERKLRLTLQTDISASELRTVAEAEHARVRTRMAALARELAPEVLSASRIARIEADGPTADTEIVRAVLEELSAIHPAPEDLRDAIEAKLANLAAFVKRERIVSMDDAEVLQVIWTPPHQRGVFIAGLAAPGPLETAAAGLPSFYLVQPVPEDWPAAQRESFLREYNDFMLEILSIHEAIPGHFVQLYFAKREPSTIRKVLGNGPFVEGWAVYAEKVMVDAGYSGQAPTTKRPKGVDKGPWKVAQTPELRAKAIALHGLKFYLRTVTNAILDHGVHASTMSEPEALTLMVDRSFQQMGEAKAKWVRAQVTSTQLSTYFVGAQAWLRLRAHAEARARNGKTEFDMAAFHDAALSHGAPPVHRLPVLMGWGEDHPAGR